MIPQHLDLAQSDDAERLILSAAVNGAKGPERLEEARAIVSSEHFVSEDHQVAWRSVCQMADDRSAENRAGPLDVFKLAERLEAAGHPIMRGEPTTVWCSKLLDPWTDAYSLEFHAGRVLDAWKARELQRSAVWLEDQARQPGADHAGLVASMQQRLEALLEGDTSRGTAGKTLYEAGFDVVEEARARMAGGGSHIPTGFPLLDQLTAGGMHPRRLWVIGAATHTGKTVLVRQWSRAAVRAGQIALIFPYEGGAAELQSIDLCAVAKVNFTQWMTKPTEAMIEQMRDANERLKFSSEGVRVAPGSALRTLDAALAYARSFSRECRNAGKRLGLISFDFLQAVKGNDSRARQFDKISDVLDKIQSLSIELDTCVLCPSQVNREAAKEGHLETGFRPFRQTDLRGSGEIAERADVLAFLQRPGMERRLLGAQVSPAEQDAATLDVQKNKQSGTIGKVPIRFTCSSVSFQSVESAAPATADDDRVPF